MTQPEPRRASIAFIVVTMVLDTLGIGLVVPVLPKLIGSFVGGDLTEASRYFGLFISAYATMQLIFAPIIGGLSDRFGRRKVILGSLFGAGMDYLFLAFAPTLPLLFVGRIFSGITGASFSSATAYIADVSPPEKRAQNFGLIGAAFGVGFIIGPAVGGVLGGISLRLPFMVASVLNLLNFAYGYFVLPESLAPENRRPFSLKRANPLVAVKNLGRHRVVLGLTGTVVCGYLAQQILQAVWALHAEGRYGWSTLEIGLSLTLVGVASVTIQAGLIRWAIPKIGEKRALVLGSLASVGGFAVLGFASYGWIAYAITLPFSLRGFVGPAAQALMTREVGASEQGELQGSLTSLQSLTAIVGPLLGTRLFAYFGDKNAAIYVPGAPFFAAAALDLLGLALALYLFMKSPPESSREGTVTRS